MTEPGLSERSIFEAAIEKSSPEERVAYLDQVCGSDVELRREIEALLAAHDGFGDVSLPGRAANLGATIDHPIREHPGTVIGPYKLLEQIGEGGFGVVFMAEQTQPIRRKVALKVLKPGMDSRQVVVRFEAERQALALMDHPHIAHVFDGGETANGRPYFVMELVRGIPITDFCDQNRLPIYERLELFVNVCQAVQHAHQKGIIHRDIKPSNVLVTLHDGTPVVKVIDFGIAKATGQQLTDKTLFTHFAQMIGTPLYMSPEQAGMSGLDVDTRSDMYSLGVLLYELLTGTTPFDRERLREADYEEIRRIIREEEPAKPSTRISTMGQAATTISTQRQSDPKRISQLLRGELDWIVMKALEKDRNRRYQAANAFAADVQRYLHDEPVLACPPSAWYRFCKFARRNKGPVLAAAVVFLALIAGVIGTTLGLIEATRQRTLAETAAGEEKKALLAESAQRRRVVETLAQVTAEKEKTKLALDAVTKARTQTRAALNSMTDEVIERLFAKQTTLGKKEKAFLRKILGSYEAFAAERGDSEESRFAAADGQFRVAEVRARLGETNEAVAGYQASLPLWQKLSDDFPKNRDYRQSWARSQLHLGIVLLQMGKRAEAEKSYRQALAIFEKLAADCPEANDYRQNVAISHNNLGFLLARLGKLPEAEAEYRQGLAIQLKLVAKNPENPVYRLDLALSYKNLGTLLRDLNKHLHAEAALGQAVEIQEQLVAEFSLEPEYRQELASTHGLLGTLLARQWKAKAAETEAAFRRALAIYKTLAARFPALPSYREELAIAHNNLGMQLGRLGSYRAAEAELREALALQEKLADDFPDMPQYRAELAPTYSNFGNLLRHQKRPADALPWYAKAIGLLNEILAQDADDVKDRLALRNAHWGRAKALADLLRHAEALKDFDRALELEEGQMRQKIRMERLLSLAHNGDHARAAAEANDLAANESLPQAIYNCACALSLASAACKDDVQRKKQYADRAMAVLTKAIAEGYTDAAHLKTDDNLAALRARDDFRRLVADLEEKSEKRKK